jgi:uncharacterized protein with PIN domain
MANVRGPQPEVKYCPRCKGDMRNVPRAEMRSGGHRSRIDGSVSPHTHTYECVSCHTRFEINQNQ